MRYDMIEMCFMCRLLFAVQTVVPSGSKCFSPALDHLAANRRVFVCSHTMRDLTQCRNWTFLLSHPPPRVSHRSICHDRGYFRFAPGAIPPGITVIYFQETSSHTPAYCFLNIQHETLILAFSKKLLCQRKTDIGNRSRCIQVMRVLYLLESLQ